VLAIGDDNSARVDDVTPGGAVPAESAGAALVRAPSRVSSASRVSSSGASVATLALCGLGDEHHCRAAAFDDVNGTLAPWRVLEPTGFSPAGRTHPIVDVDLESRRLVLFGGALAEGAASDAWTLALDDVETGAIAWRHLSHAASGDEQPAARSGACGAIDPLGHRLLVVGGTDENGAGASGLIAFDLAIERDATVDAERPKAWRAIEVETMPDGAAGCAAAWDPIEGRLIVGFGTRADAPEAVTNLWALDVSP
jgi:hypothetical protein